MRVIKKFIKLSNSQYLKIGFYYNKQRNAWYTGICIADTKRQCNDCGAQTKRLKMSMTYEEIKHVIETSSSSNCKLFTA